MNFDFSNIQYYTTFYLSRGNRITHIKIQNSGDCLDLYGGEPFASLSELVQFYIENPCQLRERDGETIVLKLVVELLYFFALFSYS